MLSNLLVLVRKDFSLFFRNRAALTLAFLVPFAMIWIFGQVFGIGKKDTGPTGIPFAIVKLSTDGAADAIAQALAKETAFRVITTRKIDTREVPLGEQDAIELVRSGAVNFALVLPADLIADNRLGLRVKLYSNPRNEIETQMVNGLMQRAIFTEAPSLFWQVLRRRAVGVIGERGFTEFNQNIARSVVHSFGGDESAILKRLEAGALLGGESIRLGGTPGDDGKSGDMFSRFLKIEAEQVVGKTVKAPDATRIVGGFAMQFLLFALSSAATALLYERDSGVFHRILASPTNRGTVLWAKFVYGTLLGLLQLVVLFLSSQVLFGTDVLGHLPLLAVVCVFAASACTAFGMLLASIASTPEAAQGLATLLILCMSALGGAWFPLSFMPEFIQHIARFTIVYWSMHGFELVLWNESGIISFLPTLGVLTAMTLGVMGIAVWRFQRSRLFG